MSADPMPVVHYCVIGGVAEGPCVETCECGWHVHARPQCREPHRARDHGRAVQVPLIGGLPPAKEEREALKHQFYVRFAQVALTLARADRDHRVTVDRIRRACERQHLLPPDPQHDWGGATAALLAQPDWDTLDAWVPSARRSSHGRRVATLQWREPAR